MNRIKLFNGKIITPQRIIADGTVIISGEKISEVSERRIEISDAIEIDAKGNYISPGFIDNKSTFDGAGITKSVLPAHT